MLGVDNKRLLLLERPVLLFVVIPEVPDIIAVLLAFVIIEGEGGPLPTAEAGLVVVDMLVDSPIITLERIMSRHLEGYTELLVDTIGVGARGDGPGIPCSQEDGGSLSAMAF